LFLAKGLFSFTNQNDEYYIHAYGKEMGTAFIEALKADRANLYSADLLRSGFLMLITFGSLWFFLKGKLKQNVTVIIIGVFMIGDLFFIDKNYVSNNPKQFGSAYEIDEPFQPTKADADILKDNSIFRVYELNGRLTGRTSYFHKAVGGYSAVRPRRYEQIFDYVIDKSLDEKQKIMLSDSSVTEVPAIIDLKTFNLSKSVPALNALNVKYLIVSIAGNDMPVKNQYANGNAWFVSELKTVNSADEEISALEKLDTKNTAVRSNTEFEKSANLPLFKKDSLASVKLEEYKPNYIKYISENSNNGFAVFSETYYKDGWKATIDGKESPIFRVDYVLRGLQIPAGKHAIEFRFDPQVVKTGSSIGLFSVIIMVLVIAGGIYFDNRKKT
jgi:hypothetical protein